MKKIITFDMVNNRKISLTNSNNVVYENMHYNMKLEQIRRLKKSNNLKGITESLRGFRDPSWKNNLSIIKELSSIDNRTVHLDSEIEFINRNLLVNIIPTISDFDEITHTLNGYNNENTLMSKIVDNIMLEICEYIECDRVLNNYNRISNRFNIDNIVTEFAINDNIKKRVEGLCELIDTYKLSFNAKLNTALETILYTYHKNGIEVDNKGVVKYVVDYFLQTKSDLNVNDINGIKKVLENNKFLSDEDISSVYYIFNETDDISNNIDSIINSYKVYIDKSKIVYNDTIDKIFSKELVYVLDHLDSIYEFMKIYAIKEGSKSSIEYDLVYRITNELRNAFKRLGDDNESMLNLASLTINKLTEFVDRYKDEMRDNVDDILDYINIINADIDTISRDMYLINTSNKYESIDAKEFDNIRHKISSYIKDSSLLFLQYLYNRDNNIDNKIEIKEKKYIDKDAIVSISDKIKNISYDEVLENFMTPDGLFNVLLYTIYIKDSCIFDSKCDTILSDIRNSCSEINDVMPSGYKIHPIITGGVISIIFNYLNKLDTENIDMGNTISQELQEHVATIYILGEACETIKDINIDTVTNELSKYMDKFILEDQEFITNTILDTMSTDIISETINTLKDIEFDNDYKTSSVATQLLSVMENYKQPRYTILETSILSMDSLSILNDIIQEAKKGTKKPIKKIKDIKKKSNNKFDIVKTGEKAINNIQLSMSAAKGKLKNLGTKEKDISNKIDMSVNQVIRGMQKSLTIDRREAAIKGYVIPSFSKMIKTATVAGAGFFIAPVTTTIASIGALMCSKSISDKERMLLLDEIEIELEVINKAISSAESDGDLDEYRHLLTIKRNLQREYQRIRYRTVIRGKKLPLSVKEDD